MRFTRSLLFAAVVVDLVFGSPAMATEEAEYQVLVEAEPFELRYYQAQVLAETLVDAGFKKAGNKAFRRLFGYISGDNQASQKVAMTAPVGQRDGGEAIAMTAPVGQTTKDGQWAISFMLPAQFTAQSAPQPTNPDVYIRAVPARHVAAIRYSGFWSEKGYQEHLDLLQSWMAEQGYEAVGAPVWARYNPPMMPWFLRRNEVLVPIASPADAAD